MFNLVLAAILCFAFLFFVFQGLKSYTKHNSSITVEDFKGYTLDELGDKYNKSMFRFKVAGTEYVPNNPPSTVIEQDPPPGSKVKEGRAVYVTVNVDEPPTIKMPAIKDKSLRSVRQILQTYGLLVGELVYRPDICEDCILEAKNQKTGKPIVEGEEIRKNSFIDLVVGDGIGSRRVAIPDLVGLTSEEASIATLGSDLNVGAIIYDQDFDKAKPGYVYNQRPKPEAMRSLNMGESIDIFVTNDKSKTIPVVEEEELDEKGKKVLDKKGADSKESKDKKKLELLKEDLKEIKETKEAVENKAADKETVVEDNSSLIDEIEREIARKTDSLRAVMKKDKIEP